MTTNNDNGDFTPPHWAQTSTTDIGHGVSVRTLNWDWVTAAETPEACRLSRTEAAEVLASARQALDAMAARLASDPVGPRDLVWQAELLSPLADLISTWVRIHRAL